MYGGTELRVLTTERTEVTEGESFNREGAKEAKKRVKKGSGEKS